MSKKEKKQRKQKEEEKEETSEKENVVYDDQEEAAADDDVKGEREQQEEGDVDEDPAAAGGKRKRKRKRKKKATEDDDQANDQEQPDQVVQHQDSVECTVYVEGIPFDAKMHQVKEFFEQNDSTITDIIELRLPTWQDSGRLRGYGHVLFGSKESYDKALALSGKHMGKRYLTIQPANAPNSKSMENQSRVPTDPPPTKDCKTLFVTNLPYGATEDEISTAFEQHGAVIAEDGVRIARNSVTRQSKGFCYVDFATPEDAQKVVKAATKTNGLSVGGRLVRLDYDTGRMKGSFRNESGLLYAKETKDSSKKQQKRAY